MKSKRASFAARPRIALFGGTFDPLHWGHLLLAESARMQFRLDRIVLMPTALPPHKLPAVASAAHRLQMLRLAARSNPFFEVSDWEARQKRVVYSYETVQHLRKRYPTAQLFFIVGTDMLRTIRKWKNSRRLIKEVTFLAAERPEVPWNRLSAGLREKSKRIEWPSVSLASHEIRGRIHQGRSIRYHVPENVEEYIRTHRLYR